MTIKPTDATKLGLRCWVLSALLVKLKHGKTQTQCKLKHGKCRRSSSLGLGLCRWHECLATIKFFNFSQFFWLTLGLVHGEGGVWGSKS